MLRLKQEPLKMNYTIAFRKSSDKYLTDNTPSSNLRAKGFSAVAEATAINTTITTVRIFTAISLAVVLPAPPKPHPRLS
jgi:hypothetical protein